MLVIKDRLYKNGGEYIDLNIISSESFSDTTTLKTQVHQTIGDYDIFERIGLGATSIKVPLYFATEEEYISFKLFVQNSQMTLVRSNFRNLIVNVIGDLSPSYTNNGNYIVTVEFTTALDPSQSIDFDINIFSYDIGSKKTFIDKLRLSAEKIITFVGNANAKIGSFTNSIELTTALINNNAQALAASQSILTTPINSIKRTVENIVDSISTVTQSLNNVVFIAKTTPSEIGNIINSVINATESLFAIFAFDNQNEQTKMNATFGSSILNAIYDINFTEEIFGSSQNVLEIMQLNEMLKVLFLCGLLINLEETVGNIDKISLVDLDYYKTSFNKSYAYVASKDIIDQNLRTEMELCKIRFFKVYGNLYAKSIKTIEVNIEIPTSLHTIVYNINGNLDFFNETMQLNNIVNVGFVSGKILVLSND